MKGLTDMIIVLRRSVALSLFSLSVAAVFLPSVSSAIDARFELDPAQVKKESGGSARRGKNARSSASHRSAKNHRTGIALHRSSHEQPAATLQLTSRNPDAGAAQDVQKVRSFWDTLVPAGDAALPALTFKSDTYELSIDPVRYPLLRAADGGVILLDKDASLPPLVRTLIQERNSKVRVVTASSTDTRRFLGELLGNAGFYSVEEQPVMTFGTDPQLKVRSDFKVERTSESVMNNEVMLVSAARQGLPVRLSEYLKTQGLKVSEPFADQPLAPVPIRHRVVRVAPEAQGQIVDLVLETLAVPAERNRRVELFRAAETGVGLSVAADRYFEYAGKSYVVTKFTGDPVTYTLFRLLETKGYRVVILEAQDNFKAVASKLLSRMDLPSSYASHLLWADQAGRYSFEMSGFMLENSTSGGGAVMLTDRPIEKAMRELLYDHGYLVQER
jgi:hypothetical protein